MDGAVNDKVCFLRNSSTFELRGLEGFGFVFLVLGFRFGFLSVAGH